MAFDWREFLVLAYELRNDPRESAQRTSIGRAYYYAYNAAKQELTKLGFDERDRPLQKMGVHQRLWSWCLSHDNPEVNALGDSGNTLKARRTAVDYQAGASPLQSTVRQQLDETREFELLLAQISSTKSPRR